MLLTSLKSLSSLRNWSWISTQSSLHWHGLGNIDTHSAPNMVNTYPLICKHTLARHINTSEHGALLILHTLKSLSQMDQTHLQQQTQYVHYPNNTFLVSICASFDMMSSLEVISDASTSANAALSRDILRVSDSRETQRLKVERTSLLCERERERERLTIHF